MSSLSEVTGSEDDGPALPRGVKVKSAATAAEPAAAVATQENNTERERVRKSVRN
jgi:hypothetical protein